jgi:hypothetical protein
LAKVKEGERVRVVTREATEDDAKTSVYFNFYGGLTGNVAKVYDSEEVAVEIEPESLTKEIRKRHEDVRDQMKTKWLDGLSEEGRSKLTEREKDFYLRYMILVKMDDLEKAGAKPAPAVKPAPAPTASIEAPASEAAIAEAPRKTLAELEAAEEEELRRRQGG